MNLKYATLPTSHLSMGISFLQPENMPKVVHIDDPARYVMVDFTLLDPVVVDQYDRMYDARKKMESADMHVSLVTDEVKNLVGFLSLDEILSDKPVKLINKHRIDRKAVLVKTVMTDVEHVVAVDYEHLRYAKVGNVISTINKAQTHYAVVFETFPPDTDTPKIRGFFNVARISRVMGENVFKERFIAPTVAELARTLHT